MNSIAYNDFSEFIPNVKFELIQIKDLTSNQEYQRNISMKHVERAAKAFDPYQINPVKVSRRNGINYVFNGQHTIEIVAKVSESRETPVWCMVYEDLDYRTEADIFANQLKYTKSLLPYEIFMANVEAGNDKELFIKSIVEAYNLKISLNKTAGGICAVATLETIYDDYGYEILDRTIRIIVGTWEGEGDSLSANMLKGVALILITYGDYFNEGIFKDKLGRISIKSLSRSAKERGNGTLGYSEAMVVEYNKKMKAGALHLSKLNTERNKNRKNKQKETEQLFSLLDSINASNQDI